METCILCRLAVYPDDPHVMLRDGAVHRWCDVPIPEWPEEVTNAQRALMLRHCFDHAVAGCARCRTSYRYAELAYEILGSHRVSCRTCHADLASSLREHARSCPALRARSVVAMVRRPEPIDMASELCREARRLRQLADDARRQTSAILTRAGGSRALRDAAPGDAPHAAA